MEVNDSSEPFVLVVCPTCHARLHPRRTLIGKRVRCPDCGVAVSVVEPERPVDVFDEEDVAEEEKTTTDEYRLVDAEKPVVAPQTVLAVCGTCGARLFPRADLVGRQVRCPDCHKPVLVPELKAPRPEKVLRPAGEYGVGAAPEPFPMPIAVSPLRAADDDEWDDESEVPEPEVPTLWFYTGVFAFPWYPATLGRWLTLTFFALFSNGIATVAWYSLPTMDGERGGGGSPIWLPLVVIAGAAAWLLMMAYASGCAFTVIRDTASGIDEVTDWSETDLYEAIWKVPFVVVPFAVAAALGSLLYLVIRDYGLHIPPGAGVPAWLPRLAWGTSMVLFPLMFVSALETGAFWEVISGTALRLVFGYFPGWLLVNAALVIVTGGWMWLTSLGVEWAPWLTVFLGAPLFAAVILIDARLIGRFLFRAHEVITERAEKARRDEDPAESEVDDED